MNLLAEDEKYFNNYLGSFFLYYENEIANIKSLNLTYQLCTNKFAELIGYQCGEELIGKNSFDNNSNSVRFAEVFKYFDLKVISTRSEITHLTIADYATGIKALHFHKVPIINPTTQNILGIRAHASEMVLPNIMKLIFVLNNQKLKLTTPPKKLINFHNLSSKQRMVLFLHINHFSNSSIAIIMQSARFDISINAVDKHLAKLRELFEVTSKEQLIEKALCMNLQSYIPKELFSQGVYHLDSDIISVL